MNYLMILSMAALLAAPYGVSARQHEHHADTVPRKLELHAGKKWATDAPLRKGMSAIRTSAASALAAAHSGKANAATYEAVAKEATGQIAYIVKNCKLDPKADAQLHIVVADIMKGVETLEGKGAETDRASGLLVIADALNAYGVDFAHPGWKPLDLKH